MKRTLMFIAIVVIQMVGVLFNMGIAYVAGRLMHFDRFWYVTMMGGSVWFLTRMAGRTRKFVLREI